MTWVRLPPSSVNVSVTSFGTGSSLAKVDFATSSFQLPVNASAADNTPADAPSAIATHSSVLIIASMLLLVADGGGGGNGPVPTVPSDSRYRSRVTGL